MKTPRITETIKFQLWQHIQRELPQTLIDSKKMTFPQFHRILEAVAKQEIIDKTAKAMADQFKLKFYKPSSVRPPELKERTRQYFTKMDALVKEIQELKRMIQELHTLGVADVPRPATTILDSRSN